MADLTEIQSSESVKIVGATSTGLEATPVNSSLTGELFTRDIINTSGVNAAASITTTAVEVKVGASRLVNRKAVTVIPTNGTIYWGFTSGVTVANGMPVLKNQRVTIAISDNVAVFAISAGTVDVRVVEVS